MNSVPALKPSGISGTSHSSTSFIDTFRTSGTPLSSLSLREAGSDVAQDGYQTPASSVWCTEPAMLSTYRTLCRTYHSCRSASRRGSSPGRFDRHRWLSSWPAPRNRKPRMISVAFHLCSLIGGFQFRHVSGWYWPEAISSAVAPGATGRLVGLTCGRPLPEEEVEDEEEEEDEEEAAAALR